MIYSPFDVYPVERELYALPDDCEGLTMLELGNKKTTIKGDDGAVVKVQVWKEFFESLGIKHTSVDWNGEDGALKLDLRAPLALGMFDYVTNIGTSEHVTDRQPAVWYNIVTAARERIVCVTPRPGDWTWHGYWYPTERFYEQLAVRNGLELEQLVVFGVAPRRNIGAAFRVKTLGLRFVMPDRKELFWNERRR